MSEKILLDEECIELARHFLDTPAHNKEAREARVKSLAEHIQAAVEQWFYEE